MPDENEKCVMVLAQGLPLGVAANIAAILGITIGARQPHLVGSDLTDREGNWHMGIIRFPVPILKGSREALQQLRQALLSPAYADVTAVDFTDLAKGCKTYEEFIGKMADCPGEALTYLGIAVCGSRKKVSRLTGSLPLLR